MNGFELQTCMAMVSIYLSLNILTMIPWIWIRLYVTTQVLKRCLQMNLCFAFFSSPLFFYANRDWKEDISYLSSPVKRSYPCTYVKKNSYFKQKSQIHWVELKGFLISFISIKINISLDTDSKPMLEINLN